MKSILHKRMLELGRGEEGVALVVTLAVFMFMYIFCAGVFAVGKMVKDRICLQNAADAAAYSAAVVQADTLSRIATINRAMSWTYAQMNKRRMDFIVYRWMEHVQQHYAKDRMAAAEWVRKSYGFSRHHPIHKNGYHGSLYLGEIKRGDGAIGSALEDLDQTDTEFDLDAVNFRRRENESRNEITIGERLRAYRTSHMSSPRIAGSFYVNSTQVGIEKLEQQIDDDMGSILLMEKKEEELVERMPVRIKTAAREILRANVPDFERCAYVVKMSDNPKRDFFERPSNSAENEYRFLEWGNKSSDVSVRRYLFWSSEESRCQGLLKSYYGSGAGNWFCSDRDAPDDLASERAVGFRWRYVDKLCASWKWEAWYCPKCTYVSVRYPGTSYWINTPNHLCIPKKSCDHVTEVESHSYENDDNSPCRYASISQTCHTRGSVLRKYYNENASSGEGRKDYSWILDCRYKQDKNKLSDNNDGKKLWAKPYLLKERFFKSDGTITVGVARPNANPWRDQYVMGNVRNQPSNIGLYHAFDPFLDWMVCFASARAGYKAVIDDEDRELENRYCRARVANESPRDYCIDFKPCCGVARKVEDRYDARYGWYKHVELVLPSWRQRWNLCQSDWDAVMIPVCRGGSGVFENLDTDFTYSYLREPCWEKTVTSYLEDLVTGVWNGPEDGSAFAGNWYRFEAGNAHSDAIHGYGPLAHPDGDLSMLLNQLPERYHGWTADVVQRGGNRAVKWPYQWRVSVPGGRLNWLELQKQMLH